MVGTINPYDIAGERQHFLNPHTSTQILDFYHASAKAIPTKETTELSRMVA